MAISWTIESGAAVAPSRLLVLAGERARALTGASDLVVSALGPAADVPVAEFDLDVELRAGPRAGRCEVMSMPEADDDGSSSDDVVYVDVTAYRSQLSVVAGLAVALALLELAGGEIGGPGLSRRYGHAEIDVLLEDLGAPASVETLAGRLGSANLPYA